VQLWSKMWAEMSLAADGAMMTGSALEISYPDWVDKLSLPYDESESFAVQVWSEMWAELSLAADSAMMTEIVLHISHPDWVDKMSTPYDDSESLLCSCGAKCEHQR